MQALELSEGQREPSPEEMRRIEFIEQENRQFKQEIELLRKQLKRIEQSKQTWQRRAVNAERENQTHQEELIGVRPKTTLLDHLVSHLLAPGEPSKQPDLDCVGTISLPRNVGPLRQNTPLGANPH